MTQHRSDTGPFALVPRWVLNAEISDRAVRLYGILADYADSASGKCWPNRKTLAARLRCSTDSVDRAKAELVGLGAITSTARQGDEGQTSNLYVVYRSLPELRLPGRQAAEGTGRQAAARNQTQLEPDPIPRAPLLLEQEEETAREPYADDFNAVWAIYPRKTARKKAEKAYVAARRKGIPAVGLLIAAENYAKARDGQDQSFTMHGATFFGPDERWRDFGFVTVDRNTMDIVAPPAAVDHHEMERRAAKGPQTGTRPQQTTPWEAGQ